MDDKKKLAISDLVLARICSLSVNQLKPFIFSGAKELFKRLDCLEKELKVYRNRMLELLYIVIPTIADTKISREILQLKRNIYNNRPVKLQKIKRESIFNIFDSNELSLYKSWLSCEEEYLSTKQDLEMAFRKEVLKNEEFLFNFFKNQGNEFLTGLPIVNHEFAKFVQSRDRKHWKRESILSKSAFSYFLRGAVKTSPLSTFTQLAVTSMDKQTIEGEVHKNRSNIRWSRAVLTSLFEGLASSPLFKNIFLFKVTDLVNTSKKGREARVRGIYSTENNIFSKTEEVLKYNQYLELLDSIDRKFSEGVSYSTLIKHINHPYPDIIADLLIEQKLIRPVAPFSLLEESPFITLSTYIRQHAKLNDYIHNKLCIFLNKLDELRKSIKMNYSVKFRNQQVDKIKRTLAAIYEMLESPMPSWIKETSLYEDVRYSHNIPHLGECIKKDIVNLMKQVESFVYPNSLYLKLVNLFIQKYGPGGHCNLLCFLSEIVESESFYSKLTSEAKLEDINKIKRKDSLKSVLGKTPITSTIYFQVVSNTYEDILSGDYLLVINKITDGAGSIFSRFNSLFDEVFYRNKLKSWLENIYPGENLTEFTIGADWSNLQEFFRVLDHSTQWLGELKSLKNQDRKYSNAVELNLCHDVKTNLFFFKNQKGETIRPVYLGSVPDYLLVGLSKLFLTVLKPWFLRIPYGSNPLNKPDVGTDVLNLPRIQNGRIVLNREQWVVPFTILQSLFDQYDGINLMRKLNLWREDHHIPDEVFVTIDTANETLLTTAKPFWFHFYSIYSADLMKKKMKEGIRSITFTEALPGINQHWYKTNSQSFNTEFMALGALLE